MSCRVKYTLDNQVIGMFAENGASSTLYPALLERVRDVKKAVDLTTLTHTGKFIDVVVTPIVSRYKAAVKRQLDTLQPKNPSLQLLHKGQEYTIDVKNLNYKLVETKGFSTIQAFAQAGDEKVMLGKVRMKAFKEGMAIESTNLTTAEVYVNGNIESLQGKGIGTEMYKYAINHTLRQGKPFYSDANQTSSAAGVWNKLKSTKVVKQEEGRNKIEAFPSSHFDKNQEVLPNVLINYIKAEQTKNKQLSFDQKQDIKNALLTLPFEDSQEMSEALQKSFYNKNGEFEVQESKLKSIYNSYEIANILSDIELQKEIKSTLEALKNNEDLITNNTYYSDDFLSKETRINSLGKMVNNNPLAIEQIVIQELGGITNENEFVGKVENLEIPNLIQLATKEEEITLPKTEENKPESKLDEGIEAVQKIAQEYKTEKNIITVSHPKVKSLFKEVSSMISRTYNKATNSPNDANVKIAYNALVLETLDQYDYIVKKGLKIEKYTGEGEPYSDSKSMLTDLRKNNTLKFLPNEEAFGDNTTDIKDNIGLQKSGRVLSDGYEMTNSEVFRVVHDYFGHGILGNQFGAIGEENATLQHLDLYSDVSAPAVIFQTRGQNSWVNFSGKNAESEKLRSEARELKKQGKEKESQEKLDKANKLFTFAEPKIGVFANKLNFKKYDTARRISEQQEIDATRNKYGSDEASKALSNISQKSIGRRGISRNSSRIPVGLQSVRGVEEVVLDNTIKNGIQKAFPNIKELPRLFEIKDGAYYRKLKEKGIINNKFKSSVTIHTAQEYDAMRMFITEDGTTGITITKDGHLGGAFSDKINGRPNDLAQLMVVGIKEGATNAEAFATILPDYYSSFGFKAVSRAEFHEKYAPKDWDYNLYAKWQEGKPDLVHFIFDGGDRNTIEDRLGQFDLYSTYQIDETPLFDKESYDASWSAMEKAVVGRYIYETKSKISENREIITPQAKTLFGRMKEFKRIPEMKIEGETLTMVNSGDVKAQLEQTFSLSSDQSISSDIIYLNTFAQDLYDENIEDVKDLIKEIEKKAAKQGVDIVGLSDKVFSKTRDEIYDLLESLNTLVTAPAEIAFNDFVSQHQSVFETAITPSVKVQKVATTNLNKSLIYLDNKASEYELFDKFNLIKVSKGVYQRVKKEELPALYDKIYAISQYNEGVLPIEAYPFANEGGTLNLSTLRDAANRDIITADIQRFIENEVSKLDLPNISTDNAVLQQMVINKYAFNHPITSKEVVNMQEEFNNFTVFDGSESYLKTDFIADFYADYLAEKIKNSNKFKNFYSNFGVNEKGITLLKDDLITIETIKDYLKDSNIKRAKDLANYSLLTDQIPNLKEVAEPDTYFNRDFLRAFYSNNAQALDKLQQDYKILSPTAILVKNNVDGFVRVKSGVYELMETRDNNSFYEMIPINASEYKVFDVAEPTSSIDNSDYGAEEINPDGFVKSEKYYNKAQEEEINNENFDCL